MRGIGEHMSFCLIALGTAGVASSCSSTPEAVAAGPRMARPPATADGAGARVRHA
jgi:hypothetical protein